MTNKRTISPYQLILEKELRKAEFKTGRNIFVEYVYDENPKYSYGATAISIPEANSRTELFIGLHQLGHITMKHYLIKLAQENVTELQCESEADAFANEILKGYDLEPVINPETLYMTALYLKSGITVPNVTEKYLYQEREGEFLLTDVTKGDVLTGEINDLRKYVSSLPTRDNLMLALSYCAN